MERIEALQSEVAEHRRRNEASYKAALAGSEYYVFSLMLHIRMFQWEGEHNRPFSTDECGMVCFQNYCHRYCLISPLSVLPSLP